MCNFEIDKLEVDSGKGAPPVLVDKVALPLGAGYVHDAVGVRGDGEGATPAQFFNEDGSFYVDKKYTRPLSCLSFGCLRTSAARE